MLQQLLLLLIVSECIDAEFSITRTILRQPHDHDIGLIFDITVSNKQSEMLDLSISSDGLCTLNTSCGDLVKAGSIYGGDFGAIEPGSSLTVSLILPTVSVFNRVGCCSIVVISCNQRQEFVQTKQLLYFDTRFEILDANNHTLRARKHFKDCKNWDLDYYRNCTPLSCEELYFGQRSFYNRTAQRCEPVPPCHGDEVYYDYFANECIDMNNFITDEEIELLKKGHFDDNYLELHDYSDSMQHQQYSNATATSSDDEFNELKLMKPGCDLKNHLSLADFNYCFQHLHDSKSEFVHSELGSKKYTKPKRNSLLSSLYYEWYTPLQADGDDDDVIDTSGSESSSGLFSLDNMLMLGRLLSIHLYLRYNSPL
ncbi:uncharacterized protein LOC108603384 isoform X2 [Drosophila busckii]|uniref:uncharacterized protein LOC108603384 isoform X2 n=1 Tax=Drosophila busckii TaxID=30019 RepID=UPI00083F5059|nr:uncharacterized protein LOC108603384 isoform X2 [Drosophila busckii]